MAIEITTGIMISPITDLNTASGIPIPPGTMIYEDADTMLFEDGDTMIYE